MKVRKSSSKQAVLEELLELGMVLVAFDARVFGVDVPGHLTRDIQLRLNLSYRFGRPLKVGSTQVEAELTFGGVPHMCTVPLAAIFLMVSHVNGEPFLFPDDVPTELLNQASGELKLRESPSQENVDGPSRPKLSLVPKNAPRTSEGLDIQTIPSEHPEPWPVDTDPVPAPRKKRTKKTVAPVEEPSHNAEDSPDAPPTRSKKRPGHLRVVK